MTCISSPSCYEKTFQPKLILFVFIIQLSVTFTASLKLSRSGSFFFLIQFDGLNANQISEIRNRFVIYFVLFNSELIRGR